MADLDAIRQRANAATKGPWSAEESGPYYEIHAGGTYEAPLLLSPEGDDEIRHEDVEFIAHARKDIPALLDELERARSVLAVWELVASREEVTAVQRLAAVRALCDSPRAAWIGDPLHYRSAILRALFGESTKDGA